MTKKWWLICTIIIVIGATFVNAPKRPKLVSCITTMDKAYLTILVHKTEAQDIEKLKKKIVELCEKDGFKEIKLRTDDKESAKVYDISVYISEKDLEEGNVYLMMTHSLNP